MAGEFKPDNVLAVYLPGGLYCITKAYQNKHGVFSKKNGYWLR